MIVHKIMVVRIFIYGHLSLVSADICPRFHHVRWMIFRRFDQDEDKKEAIHKDGPDLDSKVWLLSYPAKKMAAAIINPKKACNRMVATFARTRVR